MTGKHDAISDGYILTGYSQPAPLRIATGLDRYAIISHRNVAVADMYIPAGLRIDAVRIGRGYIMNGHSLHLHVFTELGIHRPERRVDDLHPLYLHVLATNRLDKRRTEKTTLQCTDVVLVCFSIDSRCIICLVPHRLILIHILHAIVAQINHHTKKLHPPLLSLPVQRTFTFDCYIFRIHGINQRLETLHHYSLMTHLHKGKIIIEAIRKQQSGSRLQLQSDVALHPDASRQISAGRKKKGTATVRVQAVDGRIDKFGIQRLSIHLRSCFQHIYTFCTKHRNRTKAEE